MSISYQPQQAATYSFPTRLRKIAVLGNRAVGKSSLTIQFVEGHFVDSYYPTIENTLSKVIKFKGNEYSIEIIDTAGQDEYSILNSKHAVGIHGYILVYSVTSRSSFEMVKIIRDKILNYTGTDYAPMVIVGNKVDLEVQRQVSSREASELALEYKCVAVETSAKNNDNIGKVFDNVIAQIEKDTASGTAEEKKGCKIM